MHEVMSSADFQSAGLHKLTATELNALDNWLTMYTLKVVRLVNGKTSASSTSTGLKKYVVEASVNDEKFVIDGELFEAKTYCFGIEEGDQVSFIDGSANGVCTSAEFLVHRTGKTCRVWCE
jgi:hypothetical protein